MGPLLSWTIGCGASFVGSAQAMHMTGIAGHQRLHNECYQWGHLGPGLTLNYGAWPAHLIYDALPSSFSHLSHSSHTAYLVTQEWAGLRHGSALV